jgi:hypothetical protein
MIGDNFSFFKKTDMENKKLASSWLDRFKKMKSSLDEIIMTTEKECDLVKENARVVERVVMVDEVGSKDKLIGEVVHRLPDVDKCVVLWEHEGSYVSTIESNSDIILI